MFFELTRAKFFTLALVGVALSIAIGIFFSANSAWSLLERADENISMASSEFWYWLLYKVPGGNALSAGADPGTSGFARSIPVLLYHGEGATSDMPLSVFVDQMRALRSAGWRTITMEQFDAWEKGTIQLPDKSLLLTFDDGRKDTYYQSDPVLKDMGFNAVMFVVTGFSLPEKGRNSNFYLNKTELADMTASGRWELESHGASDHATYAVQTTTDLSQTASTTDGQFLSNKFWSTDMQRFETNAEFTGRVSSDMRTSQQALERYAGRSVIAFAYPFNDFGQDSVNFPASKQLLDRIVPTVYAYAFYQTWPGNGDTYNYPLTNNGPGTTAYMEKRIEPMPTWSGQDLISALTDGMAKPLPYQSASFGREWVKTWGNVASTPAGLQLYALPSTSGADAFLNGSGWWTTYYFSATVLWQKAESVALIARNRNDVQYTDCNFTPTEALIEEHTASGQTVLARSSAPLSPLTRVRLGVYVSGSAITCYENDVAVISSFTAMESHGGIGVEIWDPALGTAKSTVTSIAVTREPPAGAGVVPQPSIPSAASQTPVAPINNVQLPVPPPDSPTSPVYMPPAPATASTTSSSTTGAFVPSPRLFMNSRRGHP